MTETTEITFKPEADHAQDTGTTTQMAEAPAPKPEASSKLIPTQIPIPGLSEPAGLSPDLPSRLFADLPSTGDLERWLQGEDVPELGSLLARLDFTDLEVRTAEALDSVPIPAATAAAPRRGPAGSRRGLPDDLKFHRLPEIGELRVRYKNHEVSRRRTEALHYGWRELGGKRPAEWTVVDLLQVLRRDIRAGSQVDPVDLLAAARDVWRGLEPQSPQENLGRERLEALGKALKQLRTDAGA